MIERTGTLHRQLTIVHGRQTTIPSKDEARVLQIALALAWFPGAC